MGYKSYKTEVLVAMKLCKHEFCEGVGILAVAESKSICPVGVGTANPGNLKKSIVAEVMDGDKGVYIGVTEEAPYGLYVEKGIGQPAQPFLEDGVMNCIPRIVNVARKHYDHGLGGK